MKLGFVSVLGLVAAVSGNTAPEGKVTSFAKRVLETNELTHRNLKAMPELDGHAHFNRRKLTDFDQEENCDKALLVCLPEEKCADCFRFLYSSEVDWANISPGTSCDEVSTYLAKKGYCPDMHDDSNALAAFCTSFTACAVWDNDEDDDDNIDTEDDDWNPIDCDALTECDWIGMYKSFIGDGICHEGYGGCYNTAICGWDGGDCCEDTCTEKNEYAECGHDGWACKDPNSTSCDSFYTVACQKNANLPDENNPDPAATKCGEDETKYRLVMYDSFGDGWDTTKMTVAPRDKPSDIRFNGGLENGSMGYRYICLPSASTCVHVDVSAGEWGTESSWEIKPMANGAPSLAAGGAPMSCDFPIAGKACVKTCDGKPNLEPNNDPDYADFKTLYTCIEQKCTIQVGACEDDDTCEMCLDEDKEDYCYGNDAFLAVVDCTMCKCTERKDSDFCHQKLSPGISPVMPASQSNAGDGSPRQCSPGETMKGSDAVLTFANCTRFDQVSMLVTNYQEDKFGPLNQFQKCAHSFAKEEDHGGHTALGCMRILVDAMSYGEDDLVESENAAAVSALAGLLYRGAGGLCDCASKASADCPLCAQFIHIKTLLYETLDACQSLDEVDCDAWFEFSKPCKSNLNFKYGDDSMRQDDACKFVRDGCGVGAFPAFRRLDCGEEATTTQSKEAWDFYQSYTKACLNDDDDDRYWDDYVDDDDEESYDSPKPRDPTPFPTPRPTTQYIPPGGSSGSKPAPTPPTPRPTTKPYIPSGPSGPSGSTTTKDYKPYDSGSTSDEGKSHGVRNFLLVCLIGAVGVVYYKRRTDAFSFVRYRNTRNYAAGESEMYSGSYSGLAMDSMSGAFQPPTLPPTP